MPNDSDSTPEGPWKPELRLKDSSFFSISPMTAQGGLMIPALRAESNSLHGLYLIKHNPGFKQRGDWLIPSEYLAKSSPVQYLLETSGLSSETLTLLEEHENQVFCLLFQLIFLSIQRAFSFLLYIIHTLYVLLSSSPTALFCPSPWLSPASMKTLFF